MTHLDTFLLFCCLLLGVSSATLYAQNDNFIGKYQITTNSALSLPGEGYKIIYYKSGGKERVDLIINKDVNYTFYYQNDSLYQDAKLPIFFSHNMQFNDFKLSKVSKSQFNIGIHTCKMYKLKSTHNDDYINFFCSEGDTPKFLSNINADIKGLPIEIEMSWNGVKSTLTLIELELLYPANMVPFFKNL